MKRSRWIVTEIQWDSCDVGWRPCMRTACRLTSLKWEKLRRDFCHRAGMSLHHTVINCRWLSRDMNFFFHRVQQWKILKSAHNFCVMAFHSPWLQFSFNCNKVRHQALEVFLWIHNYCTSLLKQQDSKWKYLISLRTKKKRSWTITLQVRMLTCQKWLKFFSNIFFNKIIRDLKANQNLRYLYSSQFKH